MPHDPYKALYLHIPYCVKKCAYCDFTSYALPRDHREIDDYVERLVLDIRHKSKEGELGAIETVYLGGGTPSHLGQRRLSMLLYALSVSMHLEPEVECTMEANPESLTPELVRDIWALGVNRLSIGVQSFDDDVLRILGRAHSADEAESAIRAAQERFENVSVDLMCGIPGQTVESFERSVRRAVDLGVAHVSVYPLTIEPGTPFARAVRRGRMAPPDDDVEGACMEAARDILTAAGFARYEVASYARPGFECRHNIAYWTGVPYLGLGTSAATMTQNAERRMRVKDGAVTDDLDPAQMASEDLMLGMRMSRGVGAADVAAASGLPHDPSSVTLGSCRRRASGLAAGIRAGEDADTGRRPDEDAGAESRPRVGAAVGSRAGGDAGAESRPRVGADAGCRAVGEVAGDGVGLLPDAQRTFDELCELGLCELRDGRYRPTERGWLCGNELYGRIYDLAP